jgi:hypothetical protein
MKKFILLTIMSIAAGTALTAQDLSVCYGKGYTLTSTADAVGAEPITYAWYENGVPLPESNSASYSIAEGREAGDYAYWRMAANAACTVSSNTYTVRVLAAPTAPTNLSSDMATACNGTSTSVTLTASGGSTGSGAVYEWGTGNTIGDNSLGTTAGNTYSVSPGAATTYWVRLKGTGACSTTTTDGAMVAVTANLAPTITLTAGDTSQVVWSGTAIEPIIYTVSNATGIILGGSLPTGVNGDYSNLTYTIQGTPTTQNKYNYTLTTTNSNGCPDTTVAGTIWAIGSRYWPPAPPNAASTVLWYENNDFWSDAIRIPDCDKTDFDLYGEIPDCRSYTSLGSGYTWYYYNLAYVNQYAAKLCPSPWRVPTHDTPFSQWNWMCNGEGDDCYMNNVYGGFVWQYNQMVYVDDQANYWYGGVKSYSGSGLTPMGWQYGWQKDGYALYWEDGGYLGAQVRCILPR